MNQITLLNELIDKRRKKYWEFVDANDWRKGLLQIELTGLDLRIKYLQNKMALKKH